MPASQALLDEVFTMLVGAAYRGERCPQLQPFGPLNWSQNRAIADLARAGRIILEVYAPNWRVITICQGKYSGRTTMRCPNHFAKPYKVIQKGDLATGQRQQPSAPRLLTQI